MRYSVIIPAAGSGRRMGAGVPKVFLTLADTQGHEAMGVTPVGVSSRVQGSIIHRSVSMFARDERCERIVVCVHPEWRGRFEEELLGVSRVTFVDGGSTRQESVYRGVEALFSLVGRGEAQDMAVLVHDAARCCVSPDVIQRVVQGVYQHGAVTAAVPVPDTLCKAEGEEVRTFVDRQGIWAIQTPQGFWLEDLRRAHAAALVDGFVGFDDASVVARMRDVRIVVGDPLNIKVTHPHDLDVARRISTVA